MTNAVTTIEFHGTNLTAVTINEQPHVALLPIVESLGLSWGSQFSRIKRHPVLSQTVFVTKMVAEDGKQRDMQMLPLNMLNGWLFGINASRVKEELREKLIRYQRECFDVLAKHFMPQVQAPALTYDRISPSQAQDLKEIVGEIVKSGAQAHAETWARLHRKFRVNSYLELPATKFQDACDYLLSKIKESGPRKPSVDLLNTRWLVYFDANGKQQMSVVPANACIMTVDEFLKSLVQSNGPAVPEETLWDFVGAAQGLLRTTTKRIGVTS